MSKSKKTHAPEGVTGVHAIDAKEVAASVGAVYARIPLIDLHIDPLNVRKSGVDEDPILTASIEAHGLQQPLIVRKDLGSYGVVAGGKRLLSLQKLHPDRLACIVPCIILPEGMTDVAMIEASLAENFARSDMHAVDEFRTFAELANDKANPQTVEQIARRFGLTVRHVKQRLALGELHPDVLKAFGEDRLSYEAAQAFTLITDKKAQRALLTKIEEGKVPANNWNIRRAIGGDEQDSGKYLQLVGVENYVKRGGKVTEDLFGGNHILSDVKLLKTMIDELLDAKCKELLAAGWKEAKSEQPSEWWNYKPVTVEARGTKEQQAQLKRLRAVVAAYLKITRGGGDTTDEQDAEAEAAEEAIETTERAIVEAALTPAIKAKAYVYVKVNHKGDAIETDMRFFPRAAPKTPEQKKKAEAKKSAPPAEAVSQALLTRLGQTITTAAQAAIVHQPNVALAALLATLASRSQAVGIHPTSRLNYMSKDKPKELVAELPKLLKLPVPELVKLLTIEVGRSLNLNSWNGAPLDQPDNLAVAEAIDGKRMIAALRETFDAKDYFAAVPRTVIVDAVREAMGDDHARNVGKMDKAAAAKFATANVPKTKWLPVQLRVKGYDGPARKPAANVSKKTAKKAKR